MIYELAISDSSIGFFPTEAEARYHAAFLPYGLYTMREWIEDGEFLLFNRETCRVFEFNN